MSLHYLVKLEMLITQVLLLHCHYRFARFESSWLQHVRTIAREGVQNMHHWSGRTETANENGEVQGGSCRHCGSHSSMASLIAADLIIDACFVHLLLQYYLPRYQLDSNLANMEAPVVVGSFSNNEVVAPAWWAFQVSQGSVEILVRWKMFTVYYCAANLFRKP